MRWRFRALFVLFALHALMIGLSAAPSHVEEVGLIIGCGAGIPLAIVFAELLWRKNLLIVATVTTALAILLIAQDDTSLLVNPGIVGVAYPIVVVFLAASLPNARIVELGGCPQCGYSLRGVGMRAGCPECGWNRPEDDA